MLPERSVCREVEERDAHWKIRGERHEGRAKDTRALGWTRWFRLVLSTSEPLESGLGLLEWLLHRSPATLARVPVPRRKCACSGGGSRSGFDVQERFTGLAECGRVARTGDRCQWTLVLPVVTKMECSPAEENRGARSRGGVIQGRRMFHLFPSTCTITEHGKRRGS